MKVLTANRLSDGRVVFLDAASDWSTAIAGARLFEDSAAAEAEEIGRAAEAAQLVTGAYLIDVRLEAGMPVPLRLRERIRVGGPTIETPATAASKPAPAPRSADPELV